MVSCFSFLWWPVRNPEPIAKPQAWGSHTAAGGILRHAAHKSKAFIRTNTNISLPHPRSKFPYKPKADSTSAFGFLIPKAARRKIPGGFAAQIPVQFSYTGRCSVFSFSMVMMPWHRDRLYMAMRLAARLIFFFKLQCGMAYAVFFQLCPYLFLEAMRVSFCRDMHRSSMAVAVDAPNVYMVHV